MISTATLLLVVNHAFAQVLLRPDSGCDFVERLTTHQTTSFKNPHWPATYVPGTTCRWTFDCPIWYACRLRCLDVGLPQTDDCYMDKLMVSASGNPDLEGAHVFCGRTEINFRSVGSRMTLALVASKLSPGGRFRCTIRSEPWTQPWFMAPCTPNPKIAHDKESTPEEKDSSHKRKIITSARTNHKRLYGDLPHTGLIQSRTSYTGNETKKTPHIKNAEVKVERGNAKHIKSSFSDSHVQHKKVDTSRGKLLKTGSSYTGHLQEASSADSAQAGPRYLDNVDDGSPRLRTEEKPSKSVHVRRIETGSPTHKEMDSRYFSQEEEKGKVLLVRHEKAESELSNSIQLDSPYLDMKDAGIPNFDDPQAKVPLVRHPKAASPENEDFKQEIKLVSPNSDSVENGAQYFENLQSKSYQVSNAKFRSPPAKWSKPRKQFKSEYLYDEEDVPLHNENAPSKKSHVRHVNQPSPNAESFKNRVNFEENEDVALHLESLREKAPRLMHEKPGYKPRINYNSPYHDNVEEGLEIIQAEPVRTRQVKAGLPYDRRTPPERPRRKHKVVHSVSHVRREQEGKRRIKHVQSASRHVAHGIIRAPPSSQARYQQIGVQRITHHRTRVPRTSRVRAHGKRISRRPSVLPYRRDIANHGEKQRKFF